MYSEFKDLLIELRKNNRMTQEKLGVKLGVVKSTIANYEKGYRKPDNDTLIKLASIFGVSTDYLLGFEDATNINIVVKDSKTRVLYNGDDKFTKQILDNTDNTDTLVMLRDMLSGVCKK